MYKTYHAQKRPKICTCCRVSEAKFYLYHSTQIAKAKPGFDDRPEYPFVQRWRAVQCCFNSASDPFNGQTPNSISKPPKVIESRT